MSEHDTGRVTDIFGQFARDLGLYTLAGFVPALTNVVALMVFTRVFPPAVYGRYALTVSVATVLGTVCYGWISQSIVRFEPHVETDVLLGNVVWLVTSIGVGFAAVAVTAHVLVAASLGEFAPFVLAGTAVIVADGTFHVFRSLLQARLESRSIVGYEVVKAAGGLALALALALVVLDDITGWLWGMAIATGVASGLLIARLGIEFSSVQVDPEFGRRMARYGFPLIGFMVGLTLLNFADQALIELFRGSDATGIYASNYSVVHYGLGLVFTPFLTSIEPILMNLWEGNNEDELATTITDMTRYVLVVGVPAVIGVGALSRVLSGLLLDSAYVRGAIVIPIVAAGLLVWYVANIGQKGIEVQERTTVLFGGIAVTVALNLVVNVVLIPRFGYVGAAIATLVSFCAYGGFVYVATRRYIPWRLPWRSVRNIAIASLGLLVPYLVFFALDRTGVLALLLASMIGGTVYLGLVYHLGELRPDELATIEGLFSGP